MKTIPEPVYPCKHCADEYSWPATDLFWSSEDDAWVCDMCWDCEELNEEKGVCLADVVAQAQAEHDAQVIERIRNKWINIFSKTNDVFTQDEIIDALNHEIDQIRQKAQEAD